MPTQPLQGVLKSFGPKEIGRKLQLVTSKHWSQAGSTTAALASYSDHSSLILESQTSSLLSQFLTPLFR